MKRLSYLKSALAGGASVAGSGGALRMPTNFNIPGGDLKTALERLYRANRRALDRLRRCGEEARARSGAKGDLSALTRSDAHSGRHRLYARSAHPSGAIGIVREAAAA